MIKDIYSRSAFTQMTPSLRVISDSQIEEIHSAGLDILSHIGMKLEKRKGERNPLQPRRVHRRQNRPRAYENG